MLPAEIDKQLEDIPNAIAEAQESYTKASLEYRRKFRVAILSTDKKSKELREADAGLQSAKEEEKSELLRVKFDLWKHMKDCVIELARNKRVEMQRGIETEGSEVQKLTQLFNGLNNKINAINQKVNEKLGE
jgi:hypothetical protein